MHAPHDPAAPRLQRLGTATTFVAELAHLGWEALHGGVRAHHILNRDSLPDISNWWGLLLLPALAWFLLGRVQRRIGASPWRSSRIPQIIRAGFLGAFAFALTLAIAFSTGHSDVAGLMFRGMLVLALLLPVYRAECVLGFVLGMTFTFGVVLPTAIATLLAGLSALVHLGIRPVMHRLWVRVRG